jgi:hypothetical protein
MAPSPLTFHGHAALEECNAALRGERDGLSAAHARIARDATELQASCRLHDPLRPHCRALI